MRSKGGGHSPKELALNYAYDFKINEAHWIYCSEESLWFQAPCPDFNNQILNLMTTTF